MRPSKFIRFYLCFAFVFNTVLSTKTNVTGSDGKVVILGDRNEVVVSTAREAKINLVDKGTSKGESMNKGNMKFLTKLHALDKRVKSMEKIERNLRVMNQSVQSLSRTLEKEDQSILKKLKGFDDNRNSSSAEIRRQQDGMNQTISYLSETVAALIESNRKMNKSNAELLAKLISISQRLSSFERHANKYALHFPRKGTSDYAIIRRGMPSLKAVTACLWMKTSDTGNWGTPLHYAVPQVDEELVLYDYRKFVIYVRNSGRRTSVSANDGKWHHICVTWENTAGSWRLYKDGKVEASGKGLETGNMIRPGGALVLGQEQDSVGGRFDARQSFIGELTDVNIWDHVIKDQEINRMSKSCLTGVGNLFQWPDFKSHIKGSVKIIEPSC
ncbi:neuronal pentraxin-2-like isoform X1 [Porites lutea]|uniref:neuronal pentraxin-2-like isoform X1 n=1 Tax=Porites lutea TaxID=51062 RepID=UPI003CC54C31